MTADRTLPDEDYATGMAALGKERLAELTWLVGYYSALALALSVFRPAIPEYFTAAHEAGELAKLRPHGVAVCDRLAWNLSYRRLNFHAQLSRETPRRPG
jgi:hypothetical protein